MKTLLLSFIYVLTLTGNSYASELPGYMSKANFDNQVFNEVKTKCESTQNGSGLGNRIETIWKAFDFDIVRDSATQELLVVGLDPQAITSIVQTKGLSLRLHAILNSDGLYRALEECYGNDKARQQTYIAGLIASEVTGRIAATTVIVAGAVATTRLLALASRTIPYFKLTILGITALSSAYQIVKIYCEANCESTAEQKALAQEIKQQVLSNPVQGLEKALSLLDIRIDQLIEQLNHTHKEEHLALLDKLSTVLEQRDRAALNLAQLSK